MTGMINDRAPIVDTKIGDLPAGIGLGSPEITRDRTLFRYLSHKLGQLGHGGVVARRLLRAFRRFPGHLVQ